MVARGDLGVEIGARDRAAAAEADHPALPRGGEAGDHGDADARVDDRARRADARRGERRRERDPRRHLGGHALGGDGDRRLPGRGGADDGLDRARGRAVDGLPPPAAGAAARRRPSAARCRTPPATSPRRSARRRSSCRRSPAAPRRRSRGCARGGRSIGLSHHQTAVQQMALEWGVTPLADAADATTSRTCGRARSRPARNCGVVDAGRPRRPHRRHRGQPARLDERDQGRRRVRAN